MKKKHAYLILAHKDDLTFHTLLKMLDYENNDVFVHFDAKKKTFDEKKISELQRQMISGRLYFTKRVSVNWGGYSLIRAELILLKTALAHGSYDYYHLLSGEDLPIQTHEDIDSFFSNHYGEQFLQIGPLLQSNGFHDLDRVRYYHFFQEQTGKYEGNIPTRAAYKISLAIQKAFRVRRNKRTDFLRGSQWFSITHELAKYVVSQESIIERLFKWTFCADELFLQTIIHGTIYEKQVSSLKSMRLIDWARGKPYVYRITDLEEIKESQELFARKFDCRVDNGIIGVIEKLYRC